MTRGLLAVVVCALAADPAAAQAPPLRWGGDKNGGAPYIFEDAAGQLVGFEVEFADFLGKELGREPVFVQNQWDNLPELLKRGTDLDIVLNGYEFSAERHADTPTTVPYFVYSLRLIVPVTNTTVASWADLGRQKEPMTVGVLRGSASERYLQQRFGDAVKLESSETVTEMFDLVKEGRVTATVQDAPAATYYVLEGRYPELKVVDEPAGAGYYVILTKPGDDALRERLNEAIRKGIRSGKLRELYQKYKLWNAAQQRLSYLAEQPWPDVTNELDAAEGGEPPVAPTFRGVLDKLAWAAGRTLLLAFASFPLAMLLGVLVALGRVYGPWLVRAPLAVYVEVLRGTPLLLQLFVVFYLLPQLGVLLGSETLKEWLSLNKYVAAILTLAVNYSAAEAENYRAGLLAVPRGQLEAALALGMTPGVAIRRVVLPQAFRIVIPPVTNDFIALFKDTAVCSTIMIVELTGLYYQYKIYPSLVLELALAVGLLYLLMSYPMAVLANWLERRTATGGAR
ncbi:ABC transporter substrate-binding protein/permease [Urbifossiella limnaea]|uniref:Inner membrane amino-acid ABC transporter permease protein YecS n=1 Tax=Urbifossiella limnaea TaxID=2528023 RepID=A0A517XX44_9BACT|nr:ABC transporter substrate-binding protein/permease [Urbifossiella limnaea]QDU22068.1 Inner membrane amino-acid ABC transporter permease protein YecS [Urbifossiella limnaea]